MGAQVLAMGAQVRTCSPWRYLWSRLLASVLNLLLLTLGLGSTSC